MLYCGGWQQEEKVGSRLRTSPRLLLREQELLKGSNCEFIKLKNESGGYTKYEWNTVRTEINRKLKDIKVNEDNRNSISLFINNIKQTKKSNALLYIIDAFCQIIK